MKNIISSEYLSIIKELETKPSNTDIKSPIFKDDGCGFGDLIACCPECGKPIFVPIWWRGNTWVCKNCGSLLRTF